MYINLLIQLKNATAVDKRSVRARFSKMDERVATILMRHGFLKKVEVKGRSFKKVMELELEPTRPIRGIRFLSRPSLRRYRGYRSIERPKRGEGIVVLSTPKGIVTGAEARREKVGGQLLFEVW